MHPLLREMADEDRKHDPWGACLGALGPICDVLYVECGHIPPSAGYRPGGIPPGAGLDRSRLDTYDPITGENSYTAEIYRALDAGELGVTDLEDAACVLDRYADLVKAAGRDY